MAASSHHSHVECLGRSGYPFPYLSEPHHTQRLAAKLIGQILFPNLPLLVNEVDGGVPHGHQHHTENVFPHWNDVDAAGGGEDDVALP